MKVVRSENIGRYGMDKRNPKRDKAARQHFQVRRYKMEIDEQFYLCEGCGTWQPFMGEDVTCDCGHSNFFTADELDALEEAVEDAERDEEYDY